MALTRSCNYSCSFCYAMFQENGLVDVNSIFVNNIENHHKIYLSVYKKFSNLQSKKNVLLDIEKRFKTLDESLKVFIEEILDKNKLRLKNSPQSKTISKLTFDKNT